MGGGFLGVDVFYVLSGFLITGLLLDEVAETGTISLVHFWARRARRLLPAAAVITVVVLVFDALLLGPFEQITRADTARAFAAYGSNILLAVRSADYFGGAATRDPLLHTWSLSVEEQFYLFFAPTLLLLAAISRALAPAVFRRRFLVATIVVSVASFVGCLVMIRTLPLIAFYILPSRAWEFGLGALTVLGVRQMWRVPPLFAGGLALAGAVGLVASAVLVKEGVVHPLGLATLVPTVSTSALILAGAGPHQTIVGRVLSTSPMRLLGRLSYSWYLWHWPMLVFLRVLQPDASVPLAAGVAVLSLIPAAITYAWIESPVRFAKGLQQRATQVVAGAVVLAALTFGLGTVAIQYAQRTLASPRYAAILAARALPGTYADGCHVSQLAVTSPPCTFGPGTNDTTLVLFGDSHAAQWFPAFDSVVTQRGWRLVNLTKRGCPSVSVPLRNPKLGRRYVECDAWRQYAIDRIAALHPTIVVLANARSYSVLVGDRTWHTDSSGLARRAWNDGMTSTLAALAPSGARLLVLEDTPQSPFDAPACLVEHIDEPARCAVPVQRALGTLVAGSERAAVRSAPNVAWMSLNGLMCDATMCPAQSDGIVRYQDRDHLSVRYISSLAPELSKALTRALAEGRQP